MSFGQIVSRGFAAAHGVPIGLLLYFLLLGTQQGLNTLVGGMFSPEVFQIKPGDEPSPELLGLIGFGCFSCIWGLISLFGTPWVTGGVVGQLRDRIGQPEGPPGRFTEYAGRFYGRMLVLALIWVAIFAALWIALMIVGAVIASTQIEPGQTLTPEKLQELNFHPANIASGIAVFLIMTLLGVIWGLAEAALVVDSKGPLAALGDAMKLCGQHKSDALKLFLLFALLGAALMIPGALFAALQTKSMAVRAGVGLLVALYFPYLIVIELGCAVSLWLARRPSASLGAAPPESPFGGPKAPDGPA
jgi:hypothetical protein